MKIIKSLIINEKTSENIELVEKLSDSYPTIVLNYHSGSYIFNDRNYINHLNDDKLIGFTLL